MGMMSKSSNGFLGLEGDDHVQAVGVSTSEAEAKSKSKPRADNDHRWPPGFRFHPTDEELVLYYLKRKICRGRLKPNMIGDIDVYKCEPWELPGKSLLQTGDKQWFFFSPRDRKYPNGVRSNRGTKCGYWKATGKDRNISRNSRTVGMKKTLVFYQGRAPKGERTNWVMHEYTISKEELKDCKTVQDSYALYKIYQKSGPGPKNGEQYGAPFQEEEWLDDDPCNDSLGNQMSGDNLFTLPELADGFYEGLSIDNVDEILRQLANDSPVTQQHVNNMSHVSEVDGKGGMQNSVVGSLHGEVISAGTSEIWQPLEQVDDAQTSLQMVKPMSSFVQPFEVPEVTSFPHWLEQEPHVADGDFVELNDLMDPQSGVLSLRSISKNYPLLNVDGLYDFDSYFDAPMYLPEEIIPPEGSVLQPYFDSSSVDVPDQSDHHLPDSFNDENQYLAANVTWTHEHEFSLSAPAEAGQVVLAPSASGIVHNPSEPWFTSAINSLLESVPTNPASASENTLISRAFERMSSFGAVRIGTRETVVAADAGTVARREGRNGFLFLSCLGAMWAILWVLMIGTMVKVFKALFGRFVAS